MIVVSKKEIDFAVFLLHKLARSWGKPVPDAYQILASTGILDDYILAHYDTLHTLGAEYLVDDITAFVHEKGVIL
ncbi:MAG: DUF3791 domain-containing protein [Coriobacteriia bacterium]|nr:DUF3791 domain-containing protein [Coriobacteriia bacterium]